MKAHGLACLLTTLGLLVSQVGPVEAGVEDWEVSEVYRGSDPNVRFVELVNLVGGCLFPTSRVELFDGEGALLATMSLSVATACHGAPTYILLASTQAATEFGVVRDRTLNPELPSSGQLCFRSSSTYYDCVRWGTVNQPIVDLFGPEDLSVADAPSLDRSLARIQTTHIVANDFSESEPTPRQPNDGTAWEVPDAGVAPDAAPTVDAGPPVDAGRRNDASPQMTADAGNGRYLDLDTVGGAGCGCQSSQSSDSSSTLLLALAALAMIRRRSQLA